MAQLYIKDTALEYEDIGSGEPVVLVHGSASDRRTWHSQIEAFSERFRLISYSRRYHWPNEPIPDGKDYSMEEHVNDLETIIQLLDAAPCHLVGHSCGAFICLLLAMRKPSMVRTLVLAEPPVITLFVSSTPKPYELLRLLITRPRTAAAIIRFGTRGVAPASRAFRKGDMETGIRIFGDAVFGPEGYTRLSEKRKSQVHDNRTNVKAEILGSGFAELDTGKLKGLNIPTLLVTGEKSISLFRYLTDRLEKLLPETERTEVPGASHMMHEDNAQDYTHKALLFLGKHREKPDIFLHRTSIGFHL